MTLPEETSKKTALPNLWVSAIFKKFQARYLGRWTSALEGIEEFAITEWADGLAGLTGEQINNGLNLCDSDWPPSLPEFRKMCLHQPVKILSASESHKIESDARRQIKKDMEKAIEHRN